MIFLFFGSSIAHLELKLQSFENWSLFVGISATWGGFGYRRGRVAEIPTNIDQFSNGCNLGSRWAIEDPKKRKIIRIWCPRWWSHQIRSSSEGIVTQGLYSYLKNIFWVQKMQFRRFLKKPPTADFFVNWLRKRLPRPFQRCRNRQWYILFHLNFILHHCEHHKVLYNSPHPEIHPSHPSTIVHPSLV